MDASPPERNASHAADLELVRGALSEAPEALRELARRLRCIPPILASRNARLGRPLTPEDLADLAQETLLLIWKKLGTFEGRAALETWVYRICCLELMNFFRKKDRRPEVAAPDFEELEAEPVVDLEPTVDHELIYRGLERLNAGEGEIVRMKHFDDLTFEGIGERLGISPNTAKTRYYRGLEKLRRFLLPQLKDTEGDRS